MISKNQLRYFSSLKLKKNRDKESKILVEGLRLLEEIFDSHFKLEYLFYCPPSILSERTQTFLNRCYETNISVEKIDRTALNKLSDTIHSQGFIGVAKIPQYTVETAMSSFGHNLVALNNVKDPGNLGTIIRTAGWFGLDGVMLSKTSVEFTNPKVIRASMGAIFHLPIYPDVDLSRQLNYFIKNEYRIFSADVHAEKSIYDIDFGSRNVFIFGNETSGVDAPLKALSTPVKIPRFGKAESLNVGISAGIILSEFKRRH